MTGGLGYDREFGAACGDLAVGRPTLIDQSQVSCFLV